MKVRVLGAHNLEAQATRHTCFLLDDVMAIDAGSLMTALRPDEQKNIEALLPWKVQLDETASITR